MKILILARGDWSGAGHALAEALRAHTACEVRQVAMAVYWTRYPADEVAPTPEHLRELLEWADIWNLHDRADTLVPEGIRWKPTIITYHGSEYRYDYASWNAKAREHGWAQTCLTQDLSLFGPRWLGRAQPDLSAEWRPEVGLICHAPTKRSHKGTESIIDAVRGLPGVHLQIIEWQTWQECLKRKSRAWLFVDQVGPPAVGYGTNALEAWAYGMPVISGAPASTVRRIEELCGEVPFMEAQPETLREQVMLLRDNPEAYRSYAEAGRRCLKLYHDPAVVAQRFVEMCTMLDGQS